MKTRLTERNESLQDISSELDHSSLALTVPEHTSKGTGMLADDLTLSLHRSATAKMSKPRPDQVR